MEEVMHLKRRAYGSTCPIKEPDCSKDGEVDPLRLPHTRVNRRSLIPRFMSRPKVVKPGCRRKVVSSATQLQTVHKDDEPIIPPTAKPKVKSTIVLIDDIPTIHMEEESGNTSAADKPTTKMQMPATDFSIFIGGKKSIPRKVMFAEQPKKKKSLIPTLRKFFKSQKADRVEEIELPKTEKREVLTAPGSHKPAESSGSKIPLFRRAPKKRKSLIPTLRKFFKSQKADRVEEIELPKTERREVLTAPGSHKPAGSSGSKIPLFRRAQILHQRFLPMPELE